MDKWFIYPYKKREGMIGYIPNFLSTNREGRDREKWKELFIRNFVFLFSRNDIGNGVDGDFFIDFRNKEKRKIK